MAKVRCKFCANEDDRKCIKTNSTVKLNKKRKCDKYIADKDKITNFLERREPIKSVYIPAVRDKSVTKLDFNKIGTTIEHPLTGDLNKFRGAVDEK